MNQTFSRTRPDDRSGPPSRPAAMVLLLLVSAVLFCWLAPYRLPEGWTGWLPGRSPAWKDWKERAVFGAFTAAVAGHVRALRAVRLDWQTDNGRPVTQERPGSEFELPCELVLLALGFLGPETDTVVSQLGCNLTERGNLMAGPDYQTTVPGVFACGDARRGQSLVVWAIWEGREAARGVDAYLMGETFLPASPEL